MADLDTLLATYEQTLRAVADLGDSLGPDDWDRPTELPGWSVKDNLSHVAGLEAALAGRPVPEHTLPDVLPHVKNDFARFMEVHVDLRRPVAGPDVVAELRSVIPERMAELRAQLDAGVTEMRNPVGAMWPVDVALQVRVFDVWCHEQDVRRAVGRPVDLTSAAAGVARDRTASALPRIVSSVAAPGQSVAFHVAGPATGAANQAATTLAMTVVVGADGRGAAHEGADPAATAALSMDPDTYFRLATGRVSADGADRAVVQGDQALGRAVLANLAMTP